MHIYVCLRTYVRIYAHTKSCTMLRNMIDDLESCCSEGNVSSVVMLYNVVDRLCCREVFGSDRYQSWLCLLFAAKKELVGSFEISALVYQIIRRHNSSSMSLSVCLSVCLSVTQSKHRTSYYGLTSKHIGSSTTAWLSFYLEGLNADLLSGCSLSF